MQSNEILRRIRDALTLDEARIAGIFAKGGLEADPSTVASWFAEPEASEHASCSDSALLAFLEGLIVELRGPGGRDPSAPIAVPAGGIDNGDVLKKLRIALDLRHSDVVATLSRSGVNPTKSDIAAWFRGKEHPLYKRCSDAVLRALLSGWRPPRRPRIVR